MSLINYTYDVLNDITNNLKDHVQIDCINFVTVENKVER